MPMYRAFPGISTSLDTSRHTSPDTSLPTSLLAMNYQIAKFDQTYDLVQPDATLEVERGR